MLKRLFRASLLATAVFLAIGVNAHATTIAYGVQFEDVGNRNNIVSGVAGVTPIPNWNTCVGASGSNSAHDSNGSFAQSLSVTYSSPNTWGNSNLNNFGGNDSLLKGYLDGGLGAGAFVTITGVPGNTSAVLTIYTDGDTFNRQSDYSVNSVDQQVFQGTGNSTTLTPDSSISGSPGNYLQFNLSGASDSTITIASNTLSEFRSPINGFELVVTVPEPGDYNHNGVVDDADYVVWRKGLGTIYTQNDYKMWRSNFGQLGGSGAGVGANAAVPEPGTLMLMMFAAPPWCFRRRRTG